LAVDYRFGFAEDTVRLAAALEPALASRITTRYWGSVPTGGGVPGQVNIDYADPWVMPT
jgi:hypothetical protein